MTPNDKPEAEKQKRMWGGRFAEDTDKLVEAFNASIDVDQKMALQDIQGSIAHATMLAEQQILSQDEAAQIIDGLDHIKQDILEGRFAWKVELEDVHMNIERALTERIGAVGGNVLYILLGHIKIDNKQQTHHDPILNREGLDHRIDLVFGE